MSRRRQAGTGSAVVALRVQGASFAEIAEQLGLAGATAASRIYLEELGGHLTDEQRQQARVEAALRLEALLRSTWGKASSPEHPEHLKAVQTAGALVDRLIRLQGLDAPTEVIVHNPTTREIEAWVQRIVEQATDVGVAETDPFVDAEIVEDP